MSWQKLREFLWFLGIINSLVSIFLVGHLDLLEENSWPGVYLIWFDILKHYLLTEFNFSSNFQQKSGAKKAILSIIVSGYTSVVYYICHATVWLILWAEVISCLLSSSVKIGLFFHPLNLFPYGC